MAGIGKLDSDKQIAELDVLDRVGLRAECERMIGIAPPPHLSVQFMRTVLIHDHQLKRSRGYSKNTKQVLKKTLHVLDSNVRYTFGGFSLLSIYYSESVQSHWTVLANRALLHLRRRP